MNTLSTKPLGHLILYSLIFLIVLASCRQNSHSHYFKNGNAKYELKNYSGALEDFNRAIELKDNYLDAFYVRALCYSNLNEYKKALTDYNKVIELNPNYKDAYINRAFYVKSKTGDYVGAVEDYNVFIELNENGENDFAFNNRGFAKFKLNDFDGAMVDIQKSISMNPENSFVYKNRALIYITLDSLELACKDLEQASKLGFSKSYGNEVEELIKEHCDSN